MAVEPDEAMAIHLGEQLPGRLDVVIDTFEQAELGEGLVDLAVAATSFHWVDQVVGVKKLGRTLRPGGCAALWWTIFDDPERDAQFTSELAARTGEHDPGGQRRSEFQMDLEGRCRDLDELAGLAEVTAEDHRGDRHGRGSVPGPVRLHDERPPTLGS